MRGKRLRTSKVGYKLRRGNAAAMDSEHMKLERSHRPAHRVDFEDTRSSWSGSELVRVWIGVDGKLDSHLYLR